MGKLKLSLLADKMSGKFGGSIISNTSNGTTFRQNSYSQQPTTPRQTIQRNKIGQVTQLWRYLSAAEKATWHAATVNYPYVNNVGVISYYTGYQLHNLVNANRYNLDLVPLSTAPAFVASSEIDVSYLVNCYLDFKIGANENASGRTLIIEATNQVYNQNKANNGSWVQIAKWDAFIIGDTLQLLPFYESIFGTSIPDTYINLRVKSVVQSNGYPSNYYNISNYFLSGTCF